MLLNCGLSVPLKRFIHSIKWLTKWIGDVVISLIAVIPARYLVTSFLSVCLSFFHPCVFRPTSATSIDSGTFNLVSFETVCREQSRLING